MEGNQQSQLSPNPLINYTQYSYVVRTYQQRITTKHPLYNILNDLTIKSNNLYNLALYHIRQHYFNYNQLINKNNLVTLLTKTQAFKELPAQTSQQVIRQAAEAMKDSIKSINKYNNSSKNYTGKPKLPKYKKNHKNSKHVFKNLIKFTNQQLKIINNQIRLPNKIGLIDIPLYLTGIQVKPSKDSLTTIQNYDLELLELRVIPKHKSLIIEYVYEKRLTISQPTGSRTASIDLGLDNFVALVTSESTLPGLLINGKGLKSYNHNFNKKLSKLQSQAQRSGNYTSNKIQNLYEKREQFIRTFMHKTSRFIVNYLKQNQVSTLIIGHNISQKQNINLGRKTNQKFVQIPFTTLINQLKYKCYESGITLIETEESYTSGTSFLDNELPTQQFYNNSRRKYRGLFVSNTGIPINSDLNAAYQIMKKEQPWRSLTLDLKSDIIHNTPLKINIASTNQRISEGQNLTEYR